MRDIMFHSTGFPVHPHEDEDLNPGILGRSLADWIKECLVGTRFEITEDINEDFGYCLIVHRKPYCLWVGCSGASDHAYAENGLDEEVAATFPLHSIEWGIWVSTESGLLSKLLRRDCRANDKKALLDLLRGNLAKLPHVTFR
jgi:hypothetical protein